MIQVKRLAHATFSTPDLEKQLDYWTRIMGLAVVERDAKRAVLASRLGQESVVLEQGDHADLQRIAFQVAPGTELGDVIRKLGAAGVSAERRSDITPGVANAVAFTDPKGTLVEIYSDYRFHSRNKSEGGVNPLKIGHVASRVHDVKKVAEFYRDVLGFRVSDWIGDHSR
jgi:catechol 2,3-dioxygenase-like lactoylglutathione lyase family enzyme